MRLFKISVTCCECLMELHDFQHTLRISIEKSLAFSDEFTPNIDENTKIKLKLVNFTSAWYRELRCSNQESIA